MNWAGDEGEVPRRSAVRGDLRSVPASDTPPGRGDIVVKSPTVALFVRFCTPGGTDTRQPGAREMMGQDNKQGGTRAPRGM